MLLGLTTYVPTFVQAVLGTGPLVAGFALATLTIGWPISATLSGRLYLRIGFRTTALIGAVLAVTGALSTTRLGPDSAVWQVGACCFVVGLGMGLISSPTLIAAQSSVGWAERGVVTATNLFARSIGSAVGVAAFGALANLSLGATANAAANPAGGGRGDPRRFRGRRRVGGVHARRRVAAARRSAERAGRVRAAVHGSGRHQRASTNADTAGAESELDRSAGRPRVGGSRGASAPTSSISLGQVSSLDLESS